MRPWKEEWEAVMSSDGPIGVVRFPGGWNVDLTGGGRNPESEERAQLAAIAPEMARMLLEAATPGHGDYVCIPRMRIEAVLRKAGVIGADKERGT